MRRRAMIVAVWLLGTVASVALAWTAVSAVGGEVTSTPGGGGGSASVAAPPTTGSSATTTTTPSAPTTVTTAVSSSPSTSAAPRPVTATPTTPTTTASPPPAERRSDVFDAVGGTVGASCTGAAASLDFATPRGGYAAEVHDAGPEKVDVRFEAEDRGESRLVIRCVDGAPIADVEEHTED